MSTGTGGKKRRLYGRKNVDDVVLRPTTASTNTKRSTRNVGQRTPNKNLQVKEWQLPPPTSAERVWDGEELDKYDLQRQRDIAAEKIQARQRSYRARQSFLDQKEAAMTLQDHQRHPVDSLLPLAYIEDCPGPDERSQCPIISDDGIIPLEKDEVIRIFHNNCGEEGDYSKMDMKSFAKALQEIADVGVRRLCPSMSYLKHVSKSEKDPKDVFREVAVQKLLRMKFIVKNNASGKSFSEQPIHDKEEFLLRSKSAIAIQTCARGFLQRRRYRCGLRANLAVSEIVAVRKMVMLSQAQCFMALLARMRVANPSALRRRLMESTKGFIFDAKNKNSTVKWKQSMLDADREFDLADMKRRTMESLEPRTRNRLSNVKAKVNSNNVKRGQRSKEKVLMNKVKNIVDSQFEDSSSDFDRYSIQNSAQSSEQLYFDNTLDSQWSSSNGNILSSTMFPTMSLSEWDNGTRGSDQLINEKSQANPTQSIFEEGANWLDDAGVAGVSVTETFEQYKERCHTSYQRMSKEKKENGNGTKEPAKTAPSILKRSERKKAKQKRRGYINGLPPNHVTFQMQKSSLPRVAQRVHFKDARSSMKPLSWDEIDNGNDRGGSTIMDWKGIEDSEIGTLLNPFQPGQALAPRPPPQRVPPPPSQKQVSFADDFKGRHKDSPLKATRILTSRQVQNYSKYQNH
eukprot:g10603.t1